MLLGLYSTFSNLSFIDYSYFSRRLDSFSLEAFENVKLQVEEFLTSVLSNQESELRLTESSINLIYANRFLKDSQKLNKKIQFIYKMEDSSLVQEGIICPFEFAKNLCFRFKTIISFSVFNSSVEEVHRVIMTNGKEILDDRQTCTRRTLNESVLIKELLNPDPIQIIDYTNAESLTMMANQSAIIRQVISSLKVVEIDNGCLILKN